MGGSVCSTDSQIIKETFDQIHSCTYKRRGSHSKRSLKCSSVTGGQWPAGRGRGWRPWERRRRPLFEQEEEEEEVIEEEVEAIFEAFCPTSSPTLSVISLSSNPPTVHSPEYSPEIHFVLCHFPLWRPERALAFPVKKIVSVFIFSFLCLVYCLEIAKGVHLLEKRLEHLRWSLLDRQRGSVKILQYHSDWIEQNLLSHVFQRKIEF